MGFPNESHSQPAVFPFQRHGSAAAAREKLAELRGLIAERFPETPSRAGEALLTGFASVDEVGGLPRASVSEVVFNSASGGGGQFVRAMLQTARRTHQHLALVDGSDGFDPQSEREELLHHLLWVRCREVKQALQATDLLVRDGNIELILLDLRGNRVIEIRRQPPEIWFRLQRMVKKSGGVLVVLTTTRLVNSAALKVEGIA